MDLVVSSVDCTRIAGSSAHFSNRDSSRSPRIVNDVFSSTNVSFVFVSLPLSDSNSVDATFQTQHKKFGRTTHAVDFSTDHEPGGAQLRFHNAAPLDVRIHITAPSGFCVRRPSCAERFERIPKIGLQAMIWRQILSVIGHSCVNIAF